MLKFSFHSLPTVFDFNNQTNSEFNNDVKKKWLEIHDKTEVFRYKLDKLKERKVNNKYLMQLNSDRGVKRRKPEEIGNISQPFDPNKFNFNKISSQEIIFNLVDEDDGNQHLIILNVSPISKYHSLVSPTIDKCLPQVITRDSLSLVLKLMFLAQDRDLRIGFNSLCGFASVNHLHYHMLYVEDEIPVEYMKFQHLRGPIFYFEETNPVPGFCLQLKYKHDIESVSQDTFVLVEYLIKNNIAHNMIITRGLSLSGCDEQVIRVAVWPRKSSYGGKPLAQFNVALCELSGWFPIYDEEGFYSLQEQDLETELRKWRIESFDKLCNEIKVLF